MTAFEQYSCDLGARLFTSARMWQQKVEDCFIIFAPDAPGLPMIVNQQVADLLPIFRSGARVGEVLSTPARPDTDAGSLISTIGLLEEKGFLKGQPDPAAYDIINEDYEAVPQGITVWLHITNSCNLACDYCFVRNKSADRMAAATLDASLDRIIATVRANALKSITIKLAGGEPTLAVDSMEYVYDRITEALKDDDVEIRFAVLSNGTALNGRVIEFLQRPGVGIGISVDGYGRFHDVHRVFDGGRRGSWDVVSRHVRQLRSLGVPPYIMATLTPESMQGIRQLVAWLLEEGLVARLNIVRPDYGTDVYGAARERSARHICESAMAGFGDAFDAIETWHEPVDVINRFNICELSFNQPLRGPACGIGRSHVVINHQGDLADCVMRLDKAGTTPGDDLATDVKRTVDATPCDADSREALGPCFRCQWFPVCGGGCPTYNTRVRGRPYGRSPLCDFYSWVIPAYLTCAAGQSLRGGAAKSPEQHHQCNRTE